MTETVILDRFRRLDVSYFLRYFDSAAKPSASEEEKARAIITQLRDQAFQFYCKRFTEKCQLQEEMKNYELVREAPKQ